MKTTQSYRKQRGFFDLGLSLGLMLVFGGTAAVVDKDAESTVAKQDEQQQIVVVKSEN